MVSFSENIIKEIDGDILDSLKSLKYLNLFNNVSTSVVYNAFNQSSITLEQLKQEIKEKCQPVEKTIAEMKEKIEAVENENVALKRKYEEIEKDSTEQKVEVKKLKEMIENPYIIYDLTVRINGNAFQVKKEVLKANSPVLKRMIDENQDADQLELHDLSEEIFQEILNFMYTKKPPNNAANLLELFAASARLEMKELKDLTAEILMEKVTPENAIDILNLCKKYGHEELRKKTFDDLKKFFPDE